MSARLGLGLIGIGRPWPGDDDEVPSAATTDQLLQGAHDLGVTFLDNAAVSIGAAAQFLRRKAALRDDVAGLV